MTSDPGTGRRVYRLNEGRLIGPIFVLAIAVVFGELARINLVFAVGTVAFVWIAYRLFRIGVFVEDGGVTVRDVLRTRRRPWQEIDRFDLVRKRGYDAGGMYLTDGTFVAPIALQGPWGQGQALPRLLAALNVELARHRIARPTNPNAPVPAEPTDQLSLPTN